MGAPAPLLDVLVGSVGALTGDFDIIDWSQQLVDACAHLTGGAAAGLFLADHRDTLLVLAVTDEPARTLVESSDGPPGQAYRTGSPAVADDLTTAALVWPEFASHAREQGYRSVYAMPLRIDSDDLGALTVFGTTPGALDRAGRRTARILADVAALGIAQHILRPRIEPVRTRLPVALHDRVVVERAKGVLAEHGGVDTTEAFARLRSHAVRTGQRLSDLAGALLAGTVYPEAILTPSNPRER